MTATVSSKRRLALGLMAKLLIVAMLVAVAGGAMAGKRKVRTELDKSQYAYSAAIRWGDFEGAWTMVDPKAQKKNPLTEADFSRYEQIQVTRYRDLATMPGPDGTELREVEIDLVNRNALRERKVRYTEIWRYDSDAKTWWVASLPDFWKGQ